MMTNDTKLKRFFDMARWEEMLEKAFEKRIDAGLLRQLCSPHNRLKLLSVIVSGRYYIQVPHIARIPKDNGDFREVFVNESIDRIFLSLYNDVMFEMYGRLIHPACKSYQKGLSCAQTVKEISSQIAQMDNDVIGYKVDLSKYFDSVSIEIIDQALDELDSGSPLDQIVREYYHNDYVFDADNNLVKHYGSLKQGCAFASFLANYVLRDVDAEMSKIVPIYVRYSDDIVIIGPKADWAMLCLQTMLERKGLRLNPNKVEQLHKNQWFTFLGYNIKGSLITFSRKAIKNFQADIEARTINANCTTKQAICNVNKYLYEGVLVDDQRYSWASRFLSVCNVWEDINTLNGFVMDCIRAVDSGRHQIGGLGENKQQSAQIVQRGTGKNVKSNCLYWKEKYGTSHIDGYLSLGMMRNALQMGRAVYDAILIDALK